jgi:glycosyltransferase involved in cell wall biosynthesis
MNKKSVDIVIPVLNEEKSLPICLEKILIYINDNNQYDWYIIIADNGSNDSTNIIASSYAEKYKNISLVTLSKRGRGRALKKAWLSSGSDVSMYMDVDLSTDLNFTTLLVDEIIKNNSDIAIGSRLHRESKVYSRTLMREFTSRAYNLLIHMIFPFPGFKDAQCGFKAISKNIRKDILHKIKDNEWFFDTELLLLSKKYGYKISEIPVVWEDDPDTRVKVLSTALKDIKGLLRVRFNF